MTKIAAEPATLANGTVVYRPRVNATVSVGKKSAIYRAIVDSGADNSMATADIVAALGAKWEKLKDPRTEMGAGGPFETRHCPGQIYYEGTLIANGFRVAEEIKVDGQTVSIFILGRSDFFAKFTAAFRWDESPPWFDIEAAP